MVTTLDMELQQAAYAALGDRRGAVIAMEPDTGKILAMVSKPGYDPNTLLQDWASLTDSSNNQGQLVNRATAGLYPPGSTFKIVTALEYMREHPDDYKDFILTVMAFITMETIPLNVSIVKPMEAKIL